MEEVMRGGSDIKSIAAIAGQNKVSNLDLLAKKK
jgi:hypothetical protein